MKPLENVEAVFRSALEIKVKAHAINASQWDLDRVREYVSALFTRFAPWQPGDRVRLCREINFDKAEGWRSERGWLQPGVVGVVQEVDYYNGKFCADIEFDVKQGHTYHLFESQLEKIQSPHGCRHETP